MLRSIFTPYSPYKKRARIAAAAWTLLIFILCLLPAKDIPEVDVPMADKWVHFVMFGAFSFLWLCSYPSLKWGTLLLVFVAGVLTGSLVEILQGIFVSLGRSKDIMDVLADSIGAALGVLLFRIAAYFSRR